MVTAENFNGFLAFVFLLSVPLTALLSVVIRRRYRKAVSAVMMSTAGASAEAFDVPEPALPNRGTLAFDVAPLPRAPRLRVGLAGRYLLAGLACSVVLVVVMFLLNGIAFLPVRFGVVVGAFAFTALIMALYVAGLRWFWILLAAVIWVGLLYAVAPQSGEVIGLLSLPSLMLALVIGNPALRRTTLTLFLVSVSLVVPMVFALDILYLALVTGILDGLRSILPEAIVRTLYVVLALAVVLGAGIGLAWAAVRLVARATATASEFMMQHDVIWLFQTIWIIGLGWGMNGPAVLLYLLAFAVYRGVLRLLRPRGDATEVNLLLRVFGQRKSQTRLSRGLLLDWRQTGPVLLIGASDLATETLDAPELAAFLSRRLDSIFITGPGDLAAARAKGEHRLGDGLFPMQDHYCRDDSWRPTVLTLMSRAHRVLIDLRGFEPENRGIRFEIDALAERVPADRITVIADSGRVEAAQALFSDAWHRAGRKDGTDTIAIRVA